MKKFTAIITLAIIIFTCCTKDESNTGSVIGEWKWNTSFGGISGKDTIKPGINHLVVLTFKSNSTYILAKDGQKITEGRYFVLPDNMYGLVFQFENFIETEGLWFQQNGVVLKKQGNEMVLTDYNVTEPYHHLFERGDSI